MAIDSIYVRYPQFKVPTKWIIYDSYSYSQKRYGFFNERRFYFGPPQEEMYSVGIYGNGSESSVGISAMHDSFGWHLGDNLLSEEIPRIERRFDKEIISKLEEISKLKAVEED